MDVTHAAKASDTNGQVAARFVRGEQTEGSAELSVSGDVLRAGGLIAVGLRAGRSTVFVRADLPGEMAGLRTVLEQALGADGLVALDRDSSLAGPLARECLGVDSARWDLWGRDLADVFAVLARRGATPAADASPAAAGVDLSKPSLAEPQRDTSVRSTRNRRSPLILVVGLLLLAVLGGTLVWTQRDAGTPSASEDVGDAGDSAVVELVDYVDPGGQFTLQYPNTWQPVESVGTEDPPDLVLAQPPSGAILVRVVPVAADIDPANVSGIKAVTDLIVMNEFTEVLTEGPVDIGGLKGYYYLYRQVDPNTQVLGIHSHFFLFQGAAMHTLVFEAVPPEAFSALAPDFDQIMQSYKATT